jgi:hypothetical protein
LEASKRNLKIPSFKKKLENWKLQKGNLKIESFKRNLKIGSFKKKLENTKLQKET